MLALFEIDGVEDLNPVAMLQKSVATFHYNAAFGKRFVKIKYEKCEIQYLELQIYLYNEHFVLVWLYADGLKQKICRNVEIQQEAMWLM